MATEHCSKPKLYAVLLGTHVRALMLALCLLQPECLGCAERAAGHGPAAWGGSSRLLHRPGHRLCGDSERDKGMPGDICCALLVVHPAHEASATSKASKHLQAVTPFVVPLRV